MYMGNKFGITMARTVINKKKTSSASKMDLNLRKKLVKYHK